MKRILVLAFFVASPALAQQQGSPNEQALAAKMVREIQDNIQCSASLIAVQAELRTAQARVKELEAKEAKPEEKKE